MKKLLFTLLTVAAFTFSMQAQDYGEIEWDVLRVGYAAGTGSGFTLGSEARYNINNKISAGLRYELAFLADSDAEDLSISAAVSTMLTADYYFKNNGNKRAFAGLGIGRVTGGSAGDDVEGGRSLAVAPRVGYELGLLRLSAEYVLSFKEEVPSYFGINAGFTIGGKYND